MIYMCMYTYIHVRVYMYIYRHTHACIIPQRMVFVLRTLPILYLKNLFIFWNYVFSKEFGSLED